jgi:phosphatidylinositol glycan class Q protein
MEYMSLDPISLALGDKATKTEIWGPSSDKVESEEEGDKARPKLLVEKLKLHTVVKHIPSQKEQALPLIINQVNCAYEWGSSCTKTAI